MLYEGYVFMYKIYYSRKAFALLNDHSSYFEQPCGFLLLRNLSVAISVSPHVCFVLVSISLF